MPRWGLADTATQPWWGLAVDGTSFLRRIRLDRVSSLSCSFLLPVYALVPRLCRRGSLPAHFNPGSGGAGADLPEQFREVRVLKELGTQCLLVAGKAKLLGRALPQPAPHGHPDGGAVLLHHQPGPHPPVSLEAVRFTTRRRRAPTPDVDPLTRSEGAVSVGSGLRGGSDPGAFGVLEKKAPGFLPEGVLPGKLCCRRVSISCWLLEVLRAYPIEEAIRQQVMRKAGGPFRRPVGRGRTLLG